MLHDLEQHRVQIRARQSSRKLLERRRADTVDNPVPVVHCGKCGRLEALTGSILSF
jgi:hypothetical protein